MWPCKTNMAKKIWKTYLQVIADVFCFVAVLEKCFEKKTKESVVETFRDISTVGVHCWYIKYSFAGACQQTLKKKIISEDF